MLSVDEQIDQIQEVLRKTPHHKATNGFIGAMRAKIARLKDRELEQSTPLRQGSAGRTAFSVRKQGDATLVLIGPPSAGKSTLINLLTNAESKVAPYAFTTVTVVPGMLKYKEAYIQILDIPGLIEGAEKGKGRGREVLSIARGADLLLIMSDTSRIPYINQMVKSLEGAGIRINQNRPQVLIEKTLKGGLEVRSNISQEIDKETVKQIAQEYGIKNGIITLKEKVTYERLFDAFSLSRVYIPAIFVINKADTPHKKTNYIEISADQKIGIENLITEIWKALKFVTVYTNGDPIIMGHGDTINDVAIKIGTEFASKVKGVKINGNGAKFPDQEVSLKTKVLEGMQIKFV